MKQFNPMGNVYPVSRLTDFMKDALQDHKCELVYSSGVEYFNVPCSFDIETSSWEVNDTKYATMYIWQFGINGVVIYGRTWEEFGMFLQSLNEALGLNEVRRLIIYVHNLGYEFQFIRKYFSWDKVFAIKRRRPVYAICGGFEFRCSLFLSNYALAYIGEELLTKYRVQKMMGDLDYSLIRHSGTPLTEKELGYCVNDVRVVMAYIQEKIEAEGDITKLPLTNTGYVRAYCRERCFFGNSRDGEERHKKELAYHAMMKSLQVTSEEEYNQLKRAFMGGFTHASCLYANQIVSEGESWDIASSYPFTLVARYFPMSKCDYYPYPNTQFFLQCLKKYCCIFDVEFTNLQPRVEYENILSASRCKCDGEIVVNNGRIVSATRCLTTLTEIDFESVSRFYDWDSMRVINLRTYTRGYLPRDLILAVLEFYKDKTSLKGVEGHETEYLVAKMMVNSVFGMMVTDIVRDEFVYDDQWHISKAEKEAQLKAYNKNFNRFLYYAWGVYVTAHARKRLFDAIYELGEDYVYSDTDCAKFLNGAAHEKYFINENMKVTSALFKMCEHYKIDFSLCAPRDPKGNKKIIGVWEHEGTYTNFMSSGAKRYIFLLKNSKLPFNITCAGLNKKFAVPYLLWKYCGGDKCEEAAESYCVEHSIRKSDKSAFITIARIAYSGKKTSEVISAISFISSCNLNYLSAFPYFTDGLIIPAGHTGKQTLTYIDDCTQGIVTDYLGIPSPFFEASSSHMENQSYLMSQLAAYLEFLSGVQEEEY